MQNSKLDLNKCYLSIKDYRVKRLIEEMGIEGFGIYIALVGYLIGSDEYELPLTITKIVATVLGTTRIKVRKVLHNYDLFKIGCYGFSFLQD